ncbi:MAG: DNA repair protein RadC [Pirellula sp.]|jgi:DNA repair protein RadC|nr:DNA repair protein RadC [Planctomycetota bacterium]
MSELRLEKLRGAVRSIQGERFFSADWAKTQCRDLAPAYVTKILKQLAKDGHLQACKENKRTYYKWLIQDPRQVDSWIEQQIYRHQIKSVPLADRPREQLLQQGAEKLTDAQLLAILIRVGVPGESAVQAGLAISSRYHQRDLARLIDASLQELKPITKAIRSDSYCQIMAGIELGRRIAMMRDIEPVLPQRIRGSDDAICYCMRQFARLASDAVQEEFHIVSLDTQHGPISSHRITVGTLDASLVHPREVFRAAIRDSASAVLLVHNHPSGDPTPSREDIAVTDRLSKVGELVGIRVLDHIVVSKGGGRSVMALR